MTIEQIANILSLFTLGLLAKLVLIVMAALYLVFTAVVFRQISLMTQVLDSRISPIVKTVSLLLIAVAVVILLLAIGLA